MIQAELLLGLSLGFGGTPDTDGDGVKDDRDECPDTPLGARIDERGCPTDADGDGVFDGFDRCEDTPRGATVDAEGCPSDSDDDGVLDGLDRCPGTPTGAKVDAKGCPVDGDGDGVFDGLDRCPETPMGAKVDAQGCPVDSDGDGVFDGLDRCPETPAGVEVDSRGCPVLFEEERADLVLEGVNFESGSDVLKEESKAVLDGVAASLKAWPEVRVEVGGHTDSMGGEALNLELSEKRAKAVQRYLIDAGVSFSQLTAKGYGESQPIADNGTPEGRATNRRVELKRRP
jgi:outer membrane protein OmpA-like peptidoglycan-associated protein